MARQARERALVAAKRMGTVFLDGEIERRGNEFRVLVVLRKAADGAEVERGEGAARALYQAVRAAMNPIERSEAIPAAKDETFLEQWIGARGGNAAQALTDFSFAFFSEDPSARDAECTSCLVAPTSWTTWQRRLAPAA